MRKNIIDRRNAEYSPLIDDFKDEVKDLNLKGITGPHFPSIGECYEDAKYKFAFCGMETYGWNKMPYFMEQKPDAYLTESDTLLNNYEHLTWAANWHATFWGFVFKFLAKFYKMEFEKLVNDKNDSNARSLLKSFVWANSNAIERYDVTSKWEGADQAAWESVKSASKRFDDINHILNSCDPKVVFIIYGGANEEYMLNEKTISDIYGIDPNQRKGWLRLRHNNPKYDYIYLRSTSTHIFHLPHPTWMGLYSGIGIDAYVDSLIQDIENYHIWDKLPNSNDDWNMNMVDEVEPSTIDFKYRLIASVAHSLVQNNVVMCGGDMVRLFNMNGIHTQRGSDYSNNISQGSYKPISSAWAYYYNRGDYQTAYEIARAFVNQNGEYAYE